MTSKAIPPEDSTLLEPRRAFQVARAPRTLSLILASAALFGCATVRRAREIQDPSSAIPGERTPTAAELALPADGLVPLEDLMRIALSVHPSILGAQRDVEIARARVREVEAALLPQVSTSASISYSDRGNVDFTNRF